MPINDVLKLTIESIAAGGAGLARFGGKPVFIEGSAPGEVVICRVVQEHTSWARAELLEVAEASPCRAVPVCADYGVCGGCNLQHLSYEAQLKAKTAILKESFEQTGGFEPPQPEVFPSPPWEYRNRVQFHCIRQFHSTGQSHHGRTNKANFGFMGRGNRDITAVRDCPVADPGIRAVVQDAASGARELPLPPEKDRFTVYSRNGLFLSEGGTRRGTTRLLDRDIAVDAGVFFQSNGVMLEKLIADLCEVAGGADQDRAMADIYCGVGTFAAFLADMFPATDVVEENKNAIGLARENVKGREREFFALRDRDWVKTAERRAGGYGFIVADPPRQGMAPQLAAWLAAQGPPLIAYVSCDPATLSRDSKILTRGGYSLSRLCLYDFYPQTSHIESLAVFSK